MAVAFPRLSYWFWGTKEHESTNSALNPSSDFPLGFREPDSIKFLSVNAPRMRPSSGRTKRKWKSREQRRVSIDREYDIVIVPSDRERLSETESDDSDWSIGWLEPHAPDFQTDPDDGQGSFAVLVPCYGRGRCEKREILKAHALGGGTDHNGFPFEGADYIERWLSSLQDM